MKNEGKYISKIGKSIADRAQKKRKRANRYAAYINAFTSGKGVANAGKGYFIAGKGTLNSHTGFLNSGKVADIRGGSHKRLKREGVKCCSGYKFQRCSGIAVLHNYENFRKSAVPARLMYFWNGTWNDFSPEASESLREAFSADMPTVEVVIHGSPYLVDFLRMLQIDLRAGCQRSIAWIDENGSCFFPKFFFEDDNVDDEVAPKVEVEIEIRISRTEGSETDRCRIPGNLEPLSEVSKTEKDDFASNLEPSSEASKAENHELVGSLDPLTDVCKSGPRTSKLPSKTSIDLLIGTNELKKDSGCVCNATVVLSSEPSKELILEDEGGVGAVSASRGSESIQCSGSETSEFGLLGDKLIKLNDSDEEYVAVCNRFLAGFGKLGAMTNITGIYKNTHASSSGQARLQAFQRHVEITKKSRGNANVRYAWHGTSGKGASGIILHGFGQPRTHNKVAAYGVGVYLSPEDCPHLSAAFSDVDQKGEQHMLLCRVILGNIEQVHHGSHQFHPSSEQFDSGADDLSNPKCYIIWSTQMNTHILPEYIVSFKGLQQPHECWAGLKAKQGIFGVPETLNCSLQDVQLAHLGSINETAVTQHPCLVSYKENQRKVQGPAKETVRMPSSASMSFPKLFSVIRKSLPSPSIASLEHLYAEYKAGRIGKDMLIRRVRMIAGDKLLIAAIQSIRAQTDHMQVYKRAEHGPQSLAASKKLSVKNEFSSMNQTSEIGEQSEFDGQNPSKPGVDHSPTFCENGFSPLNSQAVLDTGFQD
eukprot:Gb_39925 [translate_table: standard]